MQDEQSGLAVGSPAPDRVLHSDPHDFAGLYIRHRSSFTLHARRYLRDQRDADEVVQEAFLRLFLALPELETELQALAYCRRTITNLCIDRYRAQARRPSLVDLDSVPADDLAEDDPGDPVVRAEDAALVREALSMLSPLHRAALVKREIEEKPLPVIAEELEIPEESVKHVLFRARRALRKVLAGTSVAPAALAEVARKSGSGLAALVMLLAVGLGTGPDLKAIPVVGDDLPDLPGVTDLVDVVVEALGGSSGASSSSSSSGSGDAPLLAADPSPSASPSVEPATSTVTIVEEPTPTATATPSASASASPTASPTREPEPTSPAPVASSPVQSAEPTPSQTVEPVEDRYSPQPSPSASPEEQEDAASPKDKPKKPSPTPDPDSYQTEGLEWQVDPETGELVRVPVGSTYPFW